MLLKNTNNLYFCCLIKYDKIIIDEEDFYELYKK